MKKYIAVICTLIIASFTLLCGCKNENGLTYQNISNNTEPSSANLEIFDDIVKNNTFLNITAFDEHLLKSEILSENEENKTISYRVIMMDKYGNTLAKYEGSVDDAYHITTLTATTDGGFLFVLGFRDYAYSQGVWASDKGVASRVIKCDSEGNLQFDTVLDNVTGNALEFCFEQNGKLYFFGETETPSTDTRGVHSPTDIYMMIMDTDGNVLNTSYIAGSDYDSLYSAEITDDGFLLSIGAQSDDGDFADSDSQGYPVDWTFTVNDKLEIIEKRLESGRDYSDIKLGEKNGTPIYRSNSIFNSFDAGTPKAFIDYDNFYLIVSENITGEYENTPDFISSNWFYTETVYSAYDYKGILIYRSSVDSSPDYDAIVKEYETGWEIVE